MVSSGSLKLLNIKPGIDKNNTPYQDEAAYVSAQYVRFRHGNAQKIGGFINFTTSSAYDGIARDAITWSDLDAQPLYAVGTNEGLYISNGQTFYDITPVTQITPVVSVFSTTSGSPIVGVSGNAFNVATGTRFYVDPAISVDGLTIGGSDHQDTYTITSVGTNGFDFIDTYGADAYLLQEDGFYILQEDGSYLQIAGANATSTVINAGVSTNIYFLLPPGPVSNGVGGGWGSGPWGGSGGGWGAGVSGTLAVQMRQWSLATWGEDLLANPRGGALYVWDRTLGFLERAVRVSTAPTAINSIEVLSPPRILVAYGTSGFASDFDPMLTRWSDQENYSVWTPAVTNASGELRLQYGNYISGAVPTKNETLIFTDTAAYTQSYIGGDFVYSITQVGDACGLVGMHGASEINGNVFWMSNNGFFRYNGVVNKLDCTLSDNIFSAHGEGDGLNQEQAMKTYSGVNSRFSEVWWFYPDASNEENNRYVIHNYADDTWYDGLQLRTTWVDQGTFTNPIATGASTTTYYQESGTDNADGTAISTYLESGVFDIDDGTSFMLVDQILPDFREMTPTVRLQMFFYRYPNEQNPVQKGPWTITGAGRDVTYMRGRGRHASFIVRGTGVGNHWTQGKNRIRILGDGQR